ncbi:hypothetical protein OOK58_01340 [Streptomyces sp. NBC_01728]|uniref:hypothetical protein n=1 Tax=unclassified Streptomyces TaxID=2593676 RepID=UPI002251A565|nr:MULTISPECIES: hypothetical protein [unclassified Streptomyces]MCX4461354.1 hypothetical protein [Streptomyces sp. NBC_01719]MCX4490262.1 hypothetical protein [Streptomyces sp. NBC_01728]MCX4597063.1 hypothetical protein [Streptomyces sp. NBC_01549]
MHVGGCYAAGKRRRHPARHRRRRLLAHRPRPRPLPGPGPGLGGAAIRPRPSRETPDRPARSPRLRRHRRTGLSTTGLIHRSRTRLTSRRNPRCPRTLGFTSQPGRAAHRGARCAARPGVRGRARVAL